MSELDVIDEGAAYAAAVAPLLASVGGGFMISRQAKLFTKDNGLRGRQGYVIGRGSVLGDVDADVVTAAFGFWPADVIRDAWDGAREVLDVATARDRYAEVCRAWGREHLEGLADADRLAELLGWVVDGCEVVGLPLFAGWRAVPLPDDGLGRAMQLLHVLREHRGGTHLLAVIASGLAPLQAILAGAGGSGNAAFYGFEEPFESAGHLATARAEAEALTDRLVAPAYDVLSHDERLELLELLTAAQTLAFPPSTA